MFSKIKLGYPNLWFKTPDPSRVLDIITSTVSRDIYTIDFANGFSKFVDGQWKPVLIENPAYPDNSPDKYITTFDPQVSLHYLTTADLPSPTTYVVNISSSPMEAVAPYSLILSHYKSSYRKAFWSDDLSLMPLQLLFVSSLECPEELTHLFNFIEDSLPSQQELSVIVNHINDSAHNQLTTAEQIKEITHAGIGLTESEFIDVCLMSVVSTARLDPKYIYDTKMSSIKKNGILEIIKPSISFRDIGGLNNIKDIIHRTAILRKDPEQSKAFGVTPIRRLLMVGVPGTGKSAICQATAAELSLDLARTGISQVMNSFIGQSEANMRAVFKQIKAMSPLCVWIDEFGRDLSGGSSSSHVDGGTTDRVHGEFLTGLQELPEESFLLCAANSLDSLRPEMLRADRFDKIMFVGLPSYEERKHIFGIHLSKIDTDHQYDYDALAESSKYMTGAEIVSLIRETKFYVTSDSLRPITTGDILSYAPKMKNILWNKNQQEIVSMYQYALHQWDWASDEQFKDAQEILHKTSSSKKIHTAAWK